MIVAHATMGLVAYMSTLRRLLYNEGDGGRSKDESKTQICAK